MDTHRKHTPPFDSSSMGSALHGVGWETETAGDTRESLNSENVVISEINFKEKGRGLRFPREDLLDHGMGSNLS